MARDLPLGNGTMQVNFDPRYCLRDIYYPFTGGENHTDGQECRVGIWVDGTFSWLSDEGWQRTLGYHDESLVTSVHVSHEGLGLQLDFSDTVDFHENVLLRKIVLRSSHENRRQVRLFFHHNLQVSGSNIGNTAYYEPARRALFHYKGHRWFLANVWYVGDRGTGCHHGFDSFAVGLCGVRGTEGTWRDAEDGILSEHAIEQGHVDSVGAIHFDLVDSQPQEIYWWLAVGNSFDDVTACNRVILQKGPMDILNRNYHYWRLYARHVKLSHSSLSDRAKAIMVRSLLTIRTQLDNEGGVIASTDFDVVRFNQDTYGYVWPRDGALVVDALSKAGYRNAADRFFEFCNKIILKEGFFWHKYNPDASLASSWHPWYHAGVRRLPIQEDETSLVIWSLWRHFARYGDCESLKPLYRSLIIRASDFLLGYRRADGLPEPSWDIWEERWGIHAWTCASVIAGLDAGANFARAFGEEEFAERYGNAARQMQEALEREFWRPDLQRFCRTLIPKEDGTLEVDSTIDASLLGLVNFGILPASDSRIRASVEAIRRSLWVPTHLGGICRYESDTYYWQETSPGVVVPGNPWFVCTLWLAQYLIACAELETDPRRGELLAEARSLIEWTAAHALPSGILAEQLHPETGDPLSVSPLTWSHAAYLDATLALAHAEGATGTQPLGPSQLI